jgi:predicted ester cyclase
MTIQDATMLSNGHLVPDAISRYFQAWSERDVEGVLAALAGGTYADPATGGPLAGTALAEYLNAFFAAFLDVCFEVTTVRGDVDQLAVGWLMHGTNTGPLQPGLSPTGASITLPGIDLIDLEDGTIRSVQGFFDQQTLLAQLGLQVVVQPWALGPVRFGRALWLSVGRRTRPGAFSTTWIDVPNECEREEVIERTRKMFAELVQMPGFIGATFSNVGDRLSTQTAWDCAESAHVMMQLTSHKEALKRFFSGELGVAVHTSVWVPDHQNALWVRCAVCGKVEQYEPDGNSSCGEPFPDQPTYW